MEQTIILVSNLAESQWHKNFRGSLLQLGNVTRLEEESTKKELETKLVDLLVIDASAIESDIVDLVKEFKEIRPKTTIVVLTTSPTWRRAREVFIAGATNYVRRTHDINCLVEICRGALESTMQNSW